MKPNFTVRAAIRAINLGAAIRHLPKEPTEHTLRELKNIRVELTSMIEDIEAAIEQEKAHG